MRRTRRLHPSHRTPQRALRAATALGAAVCTWLTSHTALAWDGSEHEQITREAVAAVCTALAPLKHDADPAVARRAETARALLCGDPCPGGDGVCNMFRYSRGESCQLLPESQTCSTGFPQAVALVDYKNDPTALRSYRCGDIGNLRDSLKTKAYEALTADEHFHPKVVFGYSEALEIAEARAVFAGSPGSEDCPDVFRRALFNAARAMHLIEDAFAAGHAVTHLSDTYEPRQTTYMHDRYNRLGVLFGDAVDGDSQWHAQGDGHLEDPENAVNRAHVVQAATLTLCSIVRAYVGPGLSCPAMPARPGLLVPVLMDQIRSPSGLGGLRLEFASFPTLWQGAVLRYSSVYRLALGVQQPLAQRVNLQMSLYAEGFSERGFTREQLDGGALDRNWFDRNVRAFGLRPGVEYSSLPWERVVGLTAFFNAYLGWTNTDCSQHLGCVFDGGEIGLGADLYPQLFTLRIGPTYAVRRSDVREDRWSQWVGLTISGLVDRFNVY